MNQWAFVIAAYGVTAVGTIGLLLLSWWSMQSAEAAADALKRER